MFKHIFLPTDGSETSLRAVQKGIELARCFGAEITVMTAIEHFPAGIMGSDYRPEGEPPHDVARDIAMERLDAAEALVKAAGLRCHRVLTRERAVFRGIVEAAETAGADLIVMGTHGAGALERMFVGSQTQRVIAHTNLPVLTLH